MRVFVIEDESEIRELLVSQFQQEGFEVSCWESGLGVMDQILKAKPDLVLLDQRMPGKSGAEVLQDIRRHVDTCELPVMMVTGMDSEEDKVAALNAGADDYVTKPFSVRELIARAEALIRRSSGRHQAEQAVLETKELKIDFKVHRVYLHGTEISLTLTEFRILVALVKSHGDVLSRDQLREQALGHMNVSDRTIDVHMASVRKKLGVLGDRIQTVRGIGYRMEC